MRTELKESLLGLAEITLRVARYPLFDCPEMPSTNEVSEEIRHEIEKEIEEEVAEFEKANSVNWDQPKVTDVLLGTEPFIKMRAETFVYLLPRLMLFVLELRENAEMRFSTASYIRNKLRTEGVQYVVDGNFSDQEKQLLSHSVKGFEREISELRHG